MQGESEKEQQGEPILTVCLHTFTACTDPFRVTNSSIEKTTSVGTSDSSSLRGRQVLLKSLSKFMRACKLLFRGVDGCFTLDHDLHQSVLGAGCGGPVKMGSRPSISPR